MNDIRRRLCDRLAGLEDDVNASYPPAIRSREIDFSMTQQLNAIIAEAEEHDLAREGGMPSRVAVALTPDIAWFLMSLHEVRRALDCRDPTVPVLFEQGFQEDL